MRHAPPRSARSLLAFLLLVPATLAAQTVQYRAADGREFRSLADTGVVRAAQQAYERDRTLATALALGAAQSAAREYRAALATYSDAITRWPDQAVLYRWRGHRKLTLRDFDGARADLTRAVQLDSMIYGGWYHLGVVEFVGGDFAAAARAFRHALPIAPDAGERAGSTDWLWMSLARGGRQAAADSMLRTHPDSVPANNAYQARLRLYRGEIGPDQLFTPADTAGIQRATLGFGLANWYLVKGDTAKADEWFRKAFTESEGWPSFGFIGAEARVGKPTVRPR